MLVMCCIERLNIKLPVHVVTEKHVRVLFECYFVTKMVLAVSYIRLFDKKGLVKLQRTCAMALEKLECCTKHKC